VSKLDTKHHENIQRIIHHHTQYKVYLRSPYSISGGSRTQTKRLHFIMDSLVITIQIEAFNGLHVPTYKKNFITPFYKVLATKLQLPHFNFVTTTRTSSILRLDFKFLQFHFHKSFHKTSHRLPCDQP
jgi:hypothetical protein